MKPHKPIPIKRFGKTDREKKVLFGLIDYYLSTGKPVGSNTLKEAGFGDLSSATIRNYFAHLEEEGYLKQQHSSGGRIPTDKAYKCYAAEFIDSREIDSRTKEDLEILGQKERRDVAVYLQEAAEQLSLMNNTAVFMSAPRFDRDFVLDIKLVSIDSHRCLCVIVTDFGLVQTELLHTDKKLSAFTLKRIEGYFHWRLTGHDKPENLEKDEEQMGHKLYNELMVRYIVGYSNFTNDEIYRTGFSRLLAYPDFTDGATLANTLALFENAHSIRLLVKEATKLDKLRFWIGEDLNAYCSTNPNCSVVAIPYYINQKPIGAVGILGPTRMPYKYYFGVLQAFSEAISEMVTKSLYKFKITFREPHEHAVYLEKEEHHLIGKSHLMLLENKHN